MRKCARERRSQESQDQKCVIIMTMHSVHYSKTVGTTIDLGELQDQEKYQCVNVKAKALRLEDIEEVPGGKRSKTS